MSTLLVADAQRVPELAGVDAVHLQLAIDDIESEIVDRFGPYGVGAITEHLSLRSETTALVLKRKAASISSVVEYTSPSSSRTLAAGDYRLSDSGFLVHRLRSGTTAGWWWATGYADFRVDVQYVPIDDTARRKMATIDVLKAEVAYSGTGSIRIGDYAQTAGGGGQSSPADQVTRERARILGRLRPKRFVLA